MIINGPFESDINYHEETTMRLSYYNHRYDIIINDSNLQNYGYLRFSLRQELQFSHMQSIYPYAIVNGRYELLPLKKAPDEVYNFLEYRLRLSNSILEGATSITLSFICFSNKSCEFTIKDLYFGPNLIDDDYVSLTTGFRLEVNGGGITSPMPGFIPTHVDEIIPIKFYRFSNTKLISIQTYEHIYNENDERHLMYINANPINYPYQTLNVKCINTFDTGGQILATFSSNGYLQ